MLGPPHTAAGSAQMRSELPLGQGTGYARKMTQLTNGRRGVAHKFRVRSELPLVAIRAATCQFS
jgi:hypothetical protein